MENTDHILKINKSDDQQRSDEEFQTASDTTLQHSRSSSYNTASECEQHFSSWWKHGKDDTRENIAKEKMVLAVGCPPEGQLPPVNEVLKPSPEIPPGKIVREVTETTHIKVQQQHNLGVKSYVLTSEIVRDKDSEVVAEEKIYSTAQSSQEAPTINFGEGDINKDEFMRKMNECGNWIKLKILEITPELTSLGNTLSEALGLQKAHNEVLQQLQNKQSPVEELLRQADQLIATQRPRAEVYAAMAESLSRAWRDINATLELRKLILDLNVQYHTKAGEFFENFHALESACSDSVVPVEIEAVKSFLTTIHDIRRSLLESLMGALQAGNSLLGKLKELGAEGTLDSRPERIRTSVNRAISQVQSWLDELHLKRQILEATFNRRKAQLEQCLALALLAVDLKELEDILQNKRNILANSNQLGDSSSSAELLLHEHKKLLPEAQQLQERALKITKATEQLLASGCFAGEQATQQSYTILSSTSDYLTDLQNRESLLGRVIMFFRTAQTVLTKLDQLEIQLKTTELPKTSPKLAELHGQCARTIEEATSAPIAEGYAILDIAEDKGGAEGVKKMVQELENMKILLNSLCTAHKEENKRINAALSNFLDRHNEIYNWLVTIAEAFLQGHQDMGGDLRLAEDFLELHNKLQMDLQTKGNEINQLLLTLPPILEYLEDNQRRDVDSKVEELHDRWMKLKNILENRLDLARYYVKFHMEADIVNREMDALENSIRGRPSVDEETLRRIEEKFESLVPYYQSAKNTGLTFINEIEKISEPHLDTQRARKCVESALERLSSRQLNVNKSWQSFHDEVVEKREILVRLEKTMAESTKTISWASKLDSQLYPVITTPSSKPNEISEYLEHKLNTVLPDIKKAQNEVAQKIKSAEELIAKAGSSDEKTISIKNKLSELSQKLLEKASEYQILLQVLIGYFRNLEEIDRKVEIYNSELKHIDLLSNIELIIRESEIARETIMERFRFAKTECEQIGQRIRNQEPPAAAEQDVNKLRHILELRISEYENQCRQRKDVFDTYSEISKFNEESREIKTNIDEINHQLLEMRSQGGESLTASKASCDTFKQFSRVIETLDLRILKLKNMAENLQNKCPAESPQIQNEIQEIEFKWGEAKTQVGATNDILNKNIEYFKLLEEANDWFREGSKLLMKIARKSTSIKQPEEANYLLEEINSFLEPGENNQEKRIHEIMTLSNIIYGPDTTKVEPVIAENKEMLESFSAVKKELSQLSQNLIAAELENQRLKREQEEARQAEEAKKLEEQRQIKERLLAEERRLAEEARLANERREAEERRLENEKRINEEMIRMEKARLEEQARIAEENRKAEEKRLAEEARLAEEKRKQQEALLAAEAEKVEAAKLELEQLKVEQIKFIEDAKKAEEERRRLEEEEKLRIEELRIAEEKQRQEILKNIEKEKRKAEEERYIHEQNIQLEQEKLERERRQLEEEKSKAEEQRLQEEAKMIQQLKIEEERLKAEKARLEMEKLKAEKEKLEDEKHRAEQAYLEDMKRKEEEIRIMEMRKAEEARLEQLHEAEQAKLTEIRLKEEEKMRKMLEEEREKFRYEERKQIQEEIHKLHSVKITDVSDMQSFGSFQKEKSPMVEEPQESPVFITPLSDAVIQEGSKFTFICQVTGQPTPKVTWFKSGVRIENNPDYHIKFENGICSLTIEETFAEDSAKYTCKATNSGGTAETSASLSVKETEPEEQLVAPIFTKMLQPGVMQEGNPFQFHCKVDGNPLPTVQWFRNNECIDSSPDYGITYNNGEAILRIEKVGPRDNAEYTCKATNELGTAQSTANLIVTPLESAESPVFITPLSNVMARAGQKIKLECEVSGLPPPILSWSYNGKVLKETNELKIYLDGNKATLVVSETFPKHAGTYTVNAKNNAGQTSSTCTVSVKGLIPNETSDSEMASDVEPVKPSIHLPLKDIAATEGDSIRLDCVIVGQPEPEVIWYHNDQPVKESADFQLLFQGDKCSLVIKDALLEDSGDYKVVALNSAGEASSKCKLTINPKIENQEVTGVPPKFTKLLSDILVSEGDNVVFEGHVHGEPKPELKWLLNNVLITDESHFNTVAEEDGKFRLEIKSVRPEDKGVYTVKATNSVGEAKCFAQLIVKSSKLSESAVPYEEVKSAPVFKELFHDRVAFTDTPTKFECIVIGKPFPKIKWLFNGNPISGEGFLISTSGERQVLSIPNLTKEHEGTITCVAENDIGKASCAASLTVQAASEIALPEKIFQPPLSLVMPTEIEKHVETSYSVNREVITKSSTTSSNKVVSSSAGSTEPLVEEHKTSKQESQSFKQINQELPQIQKVQKVEEYHKVGQQPAVISEKTYIYGDQVDNISHVNAERSHQIVSKTSKTRPPRWVTPLVGKIIDQDVDVVLEGIIDGQPSPKISWTKDGKELVENERIKIDYAFNKASVHIKSSNVNDAGRYSCSATNEAGTAVSTADLVIRKTIFPPVFGRRLQAQVIKKNDRIVMEVEVTGTPEPTISWFKDGLPVSEALGSSIKTKSMGQNHTLIIENADLKHAGRYMVRAVNTGGEAQSIADIAVYEPTPDTMLEVVKTVVFEDVKKHETLASTADHTTTTTIVDTSLPVIPVQTKSVPKSSEITQTYSATSELTTKSEQETSQASQTFKLSHKMPDVPFPKPLEKVLSSHDKQTDYEICHTLIPDSKQEIVEEKKLMKEEAGIESSSISKESSLQYFVRKIKEDESTPSHKEFKSESTELSKKESEKILTPIIQTESLKKIPIIPVSQESTTKQETKSLSEQVYIPKEYKDVSSETICQIELKPEPPAEICYTPRQEYIQKEKLVEKIHKIDQDSIQIPSHYISDASAKTVPPPPPPKPFRPVESSFERKEMSEAFERSHQTSSYSTSYKVESSSGHDFLDMPAIQRMASKQSEVDRPTSRTSVPYFTDKSSSRPTSGLGEPSLEGLQMEKQWAHKMSDSGIEKSWSETQKSFSTWNNQTPAESKRSTADMRQSETFLYKTPVLVPHYIGEVTRLETTVNEQGSTSFMDSKSESIIETSNLKPSQKCWPPTDTSRDHIVPPTKPYPTIESLFIRPVSVQDITDEVILEPGPPPEIGYAQPPKERRRSYVEEELKKDLQREPNRVLPCSVRTIPPPPLPPKKETPQPPPVPARPIKFNESDVRKTPVEVPFRKFPDLEPFPFKPGTETTKVQKIGPPPTPSKFIKGKFTDSDYESDFEAVRIPPKWRPSMSDTDEPHYRRVRPPQLRASNRSRSQEPEPLPPSKFDHPPHFQGPPRPEVHFEDLRKKKDVSQIKKLTKHFEQVRKETLQPEIRPASPPVYVHSETKPDSPKLKKKVFIDGYMADTDEPFHQKYTMKTEHFREENMETKHISEKSQSSFENSMFGPQIITPKKSVKFPARKQFQPAAPFLKKEYVTTPIITSQSTHQYSEERHESYQSEFSKMSSSGTDFKKQSEQHLHQFSSPSTDRPTRPKFEPIEKITPVPKPTVCKPRPITASTYTDVIVATPSVPQKTFYIEPGSPPEMGYAAGPKKSQIFRSTVSAPYENAIQTETSNIVHLDESTDMCKRTMSVQQTHKVIKFGDQYRKQDFTSTKTTPFPYKSEPERTRRATSVPPPSTPSKFIPGEFRESDYESEVESTRIKPKWTPGGSDAEDLHYRRVKAPTPSKEHASQSPFSSVTHQNEENRSHQFSKSSTSSNREIIQRSLSYEPPVTIKPGTPPEYAYAQDNRLTKSSATKIASHHMDSMTKDFKSRKQKFVHDIMTDVDKKQQQKTILKPQENGDAQVYREESRAMSHGTKHVDPDTGLIYFKYDFGYEFGIVLPGESKSGEIPVPKKTIIEPPKRTSDIQMPVYHETSQTNQSNSYKAPTPQFKPKKFTNKWDPTSESEMSESEGDFKRKSGLTQGSRWEPSSCSPMSLSPSLPSTSPAFNLTIAEGRAQTPPSCPSTPGSTKLIIQPGQPRAPMFITPLRDIAVVSGQSAKFECIVQSEPPPNILWSKNGRIIENSNEHEIHYRNGVCRLTISHAYPEDAGTYSCTATNTVGTTNTTASLQVPGERRSQYLK